MKYSYNSKLGTQWQSHDQILKFFKFKMSDGRHIGKYWKCRNTHANGPIWTKLRSHLITSPTCPPWCGCHGDGRCLATAHWTCSRYGRLQAVCVNQFWWNLVYYSKLGTQWCGCHDTTTSWQPWSSRDQILKFLTFKMVDGRHVPIWTKLGWSDPIMSLTFRRDAVAMITAVT